MRHCSLMEIEYCPFRPPSSAWSRFPGGTLRSSTPVARYHVFELSRRPLGDFRREPFRLARDVQYLGVPVRERFYHALNITCHVTIVK